jgi:hypothetical protein
VGHGTIVLTQVVIIGMLWVFIAKTNRLENRLQKAFSQFSTLKF